MSNTTDAALLAAVRSAMATDEALPPAGLFDRVMRARERGERTSLAVTGSAPRSAFHIRPRTFMAAAVVAAAAASIMLMSRSSSIASDAQLFVSNGAFVSVADAQELPARAQPTAPPFTQIRGARLHAGRLAFAQRWTTSPLRDTVDARSTVEVTPVMLQGDSAWRAISVWTGNVGGYGKRVEVETLYLARNDLHLLRRDVHASPYNRFSRINISQRLTGDSVLGQMTAEDKGVVRARRPIAQRLPVQFAPFMTETLAPLMLAAAELSPGWHRSVSLLGWAVRPGDVFSSVDLRVVGEEIIQVPAGTFDCWRLELRAADHVIGYWVRKSDGLGVRTRDASRKLTKGVRDIELVREY